MEKVFVEEKTFEKQDYSQKSLPKGEYEFCQFIKCDFSGSDFSDIRFLECEFSGCNLSMVNLGNTGLQDVIFRNCKMLGLNFENGTYFGLALKVENCTLNHASFYKVKLQNTTFKNSKMKEVIFLECDLSKSLFDDCDLEKATFDNNNLQEGDFRTSYNYSIDPERNRLKGAKFSLSGAVGLLDKYQIEIG
ncbi:pentapeptide repeat-containing protein [Aliifodinibius sp. S!AR15-10]|uniref:pentapeptide repeat-containing protein n=1 Tax=Aliifodinibius sp. S!AR15-10 TaxID=2950437 RepID=UPI0028672853|nr:pentapeptide repeat-containing protein [Aliifodinibius sp. S!AR15-10]MDR8391692.1 pentapeptide repeat-containing protein [Aliifodinibius sp. S!AR15-10]